MNQLNPWSLFQMLSLNVVLESLSPMWIIHSEDIFLLLKFTAPWLCWQVCQEFTVWYDQPVYIYKA